MYHLATPTSNNRSLVDTVQDFKKSNILRKIIECFQDPFLYHHLTNQDEDFKLISTYMCLYEPRPRLV